MSAILAFSLLICWRRCTALAVPTHKHIHSDTQAHRLTQAGEGWGGGEWGGVAVKVANFYKFFFTGQDKVCTLGIAVLWCTY